MQFLQKNMENVRKNRDIKLATTEKRINYLVSEPNYHTTKFFKENVLATEIKKITTKIQKKQQTEILMNRPVYLGLSILELREILIYEFWYNYVKLKYCKKAKLC